MLGPRLLPVALLFAACIPCAFGQLPKRLEKCLPYPTLAQEIQDMQLAPKRITVHVMRVDFDTKDGIPPDARHEISTELRSHLFKWDADNPYLDDLANEIAEVDVRGALQNRGYFKTTATAKLTTLQTENEDISMVVAIRATLGPQYRTGDIRIESTDSGFPLSISADVLRGIIPLQRGEVFSVERVRKGLENLTRAYKQEGYVDMTAEPDTEIDEPGGTINLVLRISEQLQYRVGSIEFLGIDSVTREKLMEWLPKPGEVFDGTRLEEFFKANKAILPSDVSREDLNVSRDLKTRTVAILFDFRTCSSNSN